MPVTLLDPTTAAAAPVTAVGAPLTSVGETLASIEAWLLNELAQRTDIQWDTARQAGWINDAYKYITGMVKPLELDGNVALALTVGQPLYNLPAAVAYTKDLLLVDTLDFTAGGRPLDKIDLSRYRRLATLQELPRAWFRFARMAVIWPTPDTTYTAVLDFKAQVQPLVNPTDSPILQPDLHLALKLQAKRIALRQLKLYQEAALAQNDFLDAIRPVINTDAEENVSGESGFWPAYGQADLYIDEA